MASRRNILSRLSLNSAEGNAAVTYRISERILKRLSAADIWGDNNSNGAALSPPITVAGISLSRFHQCPGRQVFERHSAPAGIILTVIAPDLLKRPVDKRPLTDTCGTIGQAAGVGRKHRGSLPAMRRRHLLAHPSASPKLAASAARTSKRASASRAGSAPAHHRPEIVCRRSRRRPYVARRQPAGRPDVARTGMNRRRSSFCRGDGSTIAGPAARSARRV